MLALVGWDGGILGVLGYWVIGMGRERKGGVLIVWATEWGEGMRGGGGWGGVRSGMGVLGWRL